MHDVTTACLARQLLFWIAAAAIVLLAAPAAGKDCDLGALRCASVMGSGVEFCHWDRPRLFKQPEIVCNECRKAALGDTFGVACNAIALRNWADSDPIWLQAPMFASRDRGLVGQVQYELRRDMFGKVTIVGTMEGADVTFQRLKHRDDPMFRSIEVAACFEAVITSTGKDGTPIHYTLTGPSKAIELKEPNLWVGAQGFARLTLRPSKCRLNRGIKETPPPARPSTAPRMAAARPPSLIASHHSNDDHAADLPSNSVQSNVDTGHALHSGAARDRQPAHTAAAADDDSDDSVELVYPDGHVEIVTEQYVQQHFRMEQPQSPGMPAQPGRTGHEPQQLYAERPPVVLEPQPYVGNQPAVQYRAVPTGYGAPVVTAADPHVVMPMPPGQPGHAGAPVSVVPVMYYVTGPDQVLPANSNAYATAAF